MNQHTDTIVAQATPPGRGGVGIIRVSGPKAKEVALAVAGRELVLVMPNICLSRMKMAPLLIRASLYSLKVQIHLQAKMF